MVKMRMDEIVDHDHEDDDLDSDDHVDDAVDRAYLPKTTHLLKIVDHDHGRAVLTQKRIQVLNIWI